MGKPGRNQPCPCGSGAKYKRCCGGADVKAPDSPLARLVKELGADGIAAALDRLNPEPEPNVELISDPLEGELLVFDFPFDESLNVEVKRLPGRRFDWRTRLWLVPARRALAADVAGILRRHPWLQASAAAERWLAEARRFAGEVTVVEEEGRGRFALQPLSGTPPKALLRVAEARGHWLLLPLDRATAAALRGAEGVRLDAPARRCAAALKERREPPAGLLELGRDDRGEPRLELRTLWGFSAADAFLELPDAVEAGYRDEPATFDVQVERLAVPADPALIEALDAFLAEHPAIAAAPEAHAELERLRDERRRAHETVALSYAEDAELDPPALHGELRPFQRAGVRYTLAQRRTFIADEQGLGKTIQALATLEADAAWPAAVVCPASMKLAWEREALTWLPQRSVSVLHGRSPDGWARAGCDSADLVVLNYEVLEAHLEPLAARDLRAVVYDESHYCKDARRKRTKAAIELSRRLGPEALRLALTGTPVLNRPTELPSQLRLLGRLSDFGSGARLSRRFRGEDGLERLHWHLRAHCYVRRLKADVLPQLPPKRMVTVPVELDNEREYRLAEQDVIAWLETQPLDLGALEARVAAALRAEQIVRLEYLRSLAAAGKLAAALDWIADFTASGEPLAVFAHHREVQHRICERFPEAAHILGSDNVHARSAAVDAFQEPGGPPLIVCSMQAGSQGITLTRASNVAFLELDWTPAKHDQAEDRCHRIGQRDSVTAWYLLAPETIDETMGEVLARKRGLIGAVTDGRVPAEEGMLAAVVRDLRARSAPDLAVAA